MRVPPDRDRLWVGLAAGAEFRRIYNKITPFREFREQGQTRKSRRHGGVASLTRNGHIRLDSVSPRRPDPILSVGNGVFPA